MCKAFSDTYRLVTRILGSALWGRSDELAQHTDICTKASVTDLIELKGLPSWLTQHFQLCSLFRNVMMTNFMTLKIINDFFLTVILSIWSWVYRPVKHALVIYTVGVDYQLAYENKVIPGVWRNWTFYLWNYQKYIIRLPRHDSTLYLK